MRKPCLALAVILAGLLTPGVHPAKAEDLTVFAAASLTDVMTAAGEVFRGKTGSEVRFSFASSSTLARQIEAGAPAQIFASANESWMDYLEERQLILAGSRESPIANRLVLIAPASSARGSVGVDVNLDLPALLGEGGRLVLGDPEHVPAGIYAKQALKSLGLWAGVEDRLARTDTARAALALVESGEAPLGIVYATDAKISEGVEAVGTIPASAHTPITYPFALLAEGDGEAARAFLAYLLGEEGISIFESFGFSRAEQE
ncbi:MAG: molybdate ABC transporter substrate-binding protein [Rhodovibrionaceae bacterium]